MKLTLSGQVLGRIAVQAQTGVTNCTEDFNMTAYVQRHGFFAGRSVLLMATIAFHVLVVGALLAIKVVPKLTDVPPIMDGVVIKVVSDVVPKPVVKPDLDEFPTDKALPVRPTTIVESDESAPPIQVIATTEAPGEPAGQTSVGIASDNTALSFRALKSTDEYYPPASIRLEEKGVAQVRACVAATGELSQAPSLITSSGYARLDTAALAWVREAVRFTPATQHGVAVASCKGFRVTFRLK
jgi:TonB family protein